MFDMVWAGYVVEELWGRWEGCSAQRVFLLTRHPIGPIWSGYFKVCSGTG